MKMEQSYKAKYPFKKEVKSLIVGHTEYYPIQEPEEA